MKLAFGFGHAGFCLPKDLSRLAADLGPRLTLFGAASIDADFGVLICGTGFGIRAIRQREFRAANCRSAEMAKLARMHNQANVLCLGARLMDSDTARPILETFLKHRPARSRDMFAA